MTMQNVARECEYCGEISRPLIFGYCPECSRDLGFALDVAMIVLMENGNDEEAAILDNLYSRVTGRGVRAGGRAVSDRADEVARLRVVIERRRAWPKIRFHPEDQAAVVAALPWLLDAAERAERLEYDLEYAAMLLESVARERRDRLRLDSVIVEVESALYDGDRFTRFLSAGGFAPEGAEP